MIKKTQPQKEKSPAGRKQIFKNGEKAVPYWTSFPESKFEELSAKVEELRKPYLKADNDKN